ncbi:MAG: hypothetical protein GEU90_10470 [Gemmatimonas sp.]|nr:hypothetical protein [Gemmatimonas sp.]
MAGAIPRRGLDMTRDRNHFARSILAASDLSEASDEAVQQAARIARRGGAVFHVVSAYPAPETGLTGATKGPSDAVTSEVQSALLVQLRRILGKDEQPATAEIRFGSPASVILERAREVGAELLVLGVHRGREVQAEFLGTTADKVLRSAEVPCLALRRPVPIPIGCIGVATDFSTAGDRAVDLGMEWGKWLGGNDGEGSARLHVVHVLDPAREAELDECQARLTNNVEAHAAGWASQRSPQITSEILLGSDPATELVGLAQRKEIQLLVVGTHRKSAWQRSNLGSVSSALARRSHSPVLLVPAAAGAVDANALNSDPPAG